MFTPVHAPVYIPIHRLLSGGVVLRVVVCGVVLVVSCVLFVVVLFLSCVVWCCCCCMFVYVTCFSPYRLLSHFNSAERSAEAAPKRIKGGDEDVVSFGELVQVKFIHMDVYICIYYLCISVYIYMYMYIFIY